MASRLVPFFALVAACGGQLAGEGQGGRGGSSSGGGIGRDGGGAGSNGGAAGRVNGGRGGAATGGALAAPIAVASDASGMKLVIVGAGIWTSTDGGLTWLERAPSGPAHIQSWSSVASDATGTNLVAVVNGIADLGADPAEHDGDVWTSIDGGATWINQTAASPAHGQAWWGVASDASGTKLVAVTRGGGVFGPGAIWTSTDAGVTWTNRTANETSTSPQSWNAVASDATGTKLVAVTTNWGISTSIDGGATWTWTDRTPPDQSLFWYSVASDATGNKIVTATDHGDIWTSVDGGVTWRAAGLGPQTWIAVASDSTGTNLAAIAGFADIWTSADAGVSWTNQTTLDPKASGNWAAVVLNAAGDHLVAVGRSGIWRK
jgi:hypothetical protein